MMGKWFTIWFLVFLFGSLFSLYSVVRHLRLESFVFDLGFYDQLIWLASQGKPLFLTTQGYHAWANHINPSLLLLAPLYWLWDSEIVLLLFQAFFVALGAYPVYTFALKKLKNVKTALLISLSYLLFFGIQNAIAYDFHPLALATTILSFALWFYEEKRFKLFYVSLILLAFLQENFFVLVAAIGVFIYFRPDEDKLGNKKRGVSITFISLCTYVLLIWILVPIVYGKPYVFLPRGIHNPFEVEKIKLAGTAFVSFGFLPLLSPSYSILLGEEFFQRFVFAPNNNYWQFGYHYNALLAPILAYASIEAIQKYLVKKQLAAQILLVSGTVASLVIVKPDIMRNMRPSWFSLSKYQDAKEIFSLIPNTASVAATNNLGPHLTHREKLVLLADCRIQDNLYETKFIYRCPEWMPEYIVADLDPKVGNNLWPDGSLETITSYLEYVDKEKGYDLVRRKGTLVLYRASRSE